MPIIYVYPVPPETIAAATAASLDARTRAELDSDPSLIEAEQSALVLLAADLKRAGLLDPVGELLGLVGREINARSYPSGVPQQG